MSDAGSIVGDALQSRLREARDSPAVLKLRLSTLRSRHPDLVVLAFEGVEDKIVYSQWIGRVRADLNYEPFPCKGKKGVLNLIEIIRRDLGGDGRKVFGFVDRDFDDLQGAATDSRLFMTNSYSTENLFVERGVLGALLMNEFHCHGEPTTRDAICAMFETAYRTFLDTAKETNRRLFIARKLKMKLEKQLPEKLNDRLAVALEGVVSTGLAAAEVVSLSVEPDVIEATRLSAEFEALDPKERYRGKWALAFFEHWLRLLVLEYQTPKRGLFAKIERGNKVRVAELVRSNFASKSPLPVGFAPFVQAIPA